MKPPVTPSNDKIAESRKKAESRKIRRLEDARKLRTEADQWRAEALSQERGLKKKEKNSLLMRFVTRNSKSRRCV